MYDSLPEDCKNNGIFFTDGLSSYRKVFPADRHNLTFRQRLSALIRKTLSFSRSMENLNASVWMFIQNYNNSILFD
jgi:IS1 family transposase